MVYHVVYICICHEVSTDFGRKVAPNDNLHTCIRYPTFNNTLAYTVVTTLRSQSTHDRCQIWISFLLTQSQPSPRVIMFAYQAIYFVDNKNMTRENFFEFSQIFLFHENKFSQLRANLVDVKFRVIFILTHHSDVIMGVMASQITGVMIVYLNIYSGADQRKHQSSAPQAFVRVIHRWPENSPHKGGLVTRKMSPFDDVIMP